MKSIGEQYINEMYDKFGYRATWEPNLSLSLGDIGILENNVFTRIPSLKMKKLFFLF